MHKKRREEEEKKVNGIGNGFYFIYRSRLYRGRKWDKWDKRASYKKALRFRVYITV